MRNRRSVLEMLFLGFLVLSLAACKGHSSTPATITLASVSISPANLLMPVNSTQQFTATGLYTDGTSQVLTTQVSWSSSNPSALTVSSSGLATALGPGSATITATPEIPGTTISGSTSLAVTSATLTPTPISVTPANATIHVAIAQQFTATGTYSDGSSQDITTQVTWTSSNPSVANINSSGLALPYAAGTGNITAQFGNQSGSATLTVSAATLSSISVTPTNPSIPVGVTQQFTAIGTYSDGTSVDITTQVTWGSSNPAVATVTTDGLATAVAAGSLIITASSGGISGSATLMVTSATLSSVSVTPVNSSLASGLTLQFTATGGYSGGTSHNLTTQVIWATTNTSVVRVNANGLATAGKGGTVSVVATLGTVTGRTTLTVQ